MAKAPAKKKPSPAKIAAPNPGYRVAEAYEEIPSGDGVMRVEAGDYVVDTEDGVAVMPPERFAAFTAVGD